MTEDKAFADLTAIADIPEAGPVIVTATSDSTEVDESAAVNDSGPDNSDETDDEAHGFLEDSAGTPNTDSEVTSDNALANVDSDTTHGVWAFLSTLMS